MNIESDLRTFRADLHVHTVLSPCADVEMIPPLIVRKALETGISLIAITDHNATANILAVQKAAKGSGLSVLPGMEVQTKEEVHSLCIFDTFDQVHEWQNYVSKAMPPIQNRPDFFGEQFVVDETGDYIRSEAQLLITSADISLNEAWNTVNQLGGILIPAHVNRKMFGLIHMLGFVPSDITLEALEISRHITPEHAYQLFPQIVGFPLIQNGDVHLLDDFLGNNIFCIANPTVAEIRMALTRQNDRFIEYQNILTTT